MEKPTTETVIIKRLLNKVIKYIEQKYIKAKLFRKI